MARITAVVVVFAVTGLGGCGGGGKAAAPSVLLQDEDSAPDPEDEATPPESEAQVDGCVLPKGARSFDELKGPGEALDGACVPEIDRAGLNEAFVRLRDTQLGPDEAPDDSSTLVDEHGLARRLPWLLADNGCEERAPAAAYLMNAWGYPTPYYARAKAKSRKKLHLDTRNFPGPVTWDGHVAPVLRCEGTLYVLDPAVEAERPITVSEWLTRITYKGAVSDLNAALCRDEPVGGGCFTEAPRGTYFPQGELVGHLPVEWRLQQVLGRLPEEALGDCPPWRGCGNEPPPRSSPDLPPVLKEVISYDAGAWGVVTPLAIVGENFVEGFTRVELATDGVQEEITVDSWNPRVLRIDAALPPGHYRATLFNGDHASEPVDFDLEN